MANLKIRNTLLAIGATAIILISPYTNQKISYSPEYSINYNYTGNFSEIPFASCSIGYVYIVKDKCEIEDVCNNSVYIIDQRDDEEDPNIQVYNSHMIKHEKIMCEIIEIIQKYEEMFPSNWERTNDSMLVEWEIHNICSNNHYKRKRTDHVDFNNKDEENYSIKTLKKILTN